MELVEEHLKVDATVRMAVERGKPRGRLTGAAIAGPCRPESDAVIVRDWCQAVNELCRNLDTARRFDPGAEPQARAAVDQFLREHGGVAQLIVDRASADVGLAQASYLYALCRQEMAERR